MSGWLLVLGRCSEVRRTGKSAWATERLRTLACGRQELAIVLGALRWHRQECLCY